MTMQFPPTKVLYQTPLLGMQHFQMVYGKFLSAPSIFLAS